MPTATVTVRDVKNKDTGIDLTVPTFKEVKGMLSSTFFYRVVVVSNVQVFKSPKHKDTDTVQFMVEKKFGDFEELYDKLNGKFSGTVLPPLPKKVFLVNEPIARARRTELEHFLRFIASVPKMAICPDVLEFLGVGSMKAGAYRKGEVGGGGGESEENVEGQEGNSDLDTDKQEPEASLFDEEDVQDGEELFGAADTEADFNEEDATKIFEDPDLGGGISQEDDESLFLPDAVVKKKLEPTSSLPETDPSFYEIDHDLDDIMTKDISKMRRDEAVASKPKLKPKPALKPKPGKKNEPEVTTAFSSDDILSYIQDNATNDETDLDLFS